LQPQHVGVDRGRRTGDVRRLLRRSEDVDHVDVAVDLP
jgi:hypothetical protein